LNKQVTVYGAYGHTGRFVVSELRKRGLRPVLSGRSVAKLRALGEAHPTLDTRVATVDDSSSLSAALSGSSAVINCAGPFLDTSAPIIEAAIRAGIHYLDVTAEQLAVRAAFERFADAAQDASIVIAPAVAFYGGLADLLATAAMGSWASADEIRVAIALDSWQPTLGTRVTGKRNTARRFVISNDKLEFLADPPPTAVWDFPPPFGKQDVVGLPFSEIITISNHLQAAEVHSYINVAPLRDVRDPDTPVPVAADESGRSSQIFLVDVIARKGTEERHATAHGRDIYAVTAPIVVEATERILEGRFTRTGVAAAGELFDAQDFLESLSPEHLDWDTSAVSESPRDVTKSAEPRRNDYPRR
jgi:NAD(P)-dependent dehydrogenase (short-subunit alcohol dehydrogenase family)